MLFDVKQRFDGIPQKEIPELKRFVTNAVP